MAIEVGALSLALEAGVQETLDGLKKVDQAAASVAARQQQHTDAIAAATQREREAKKVLLGLQKQQNAALKVMEDRLANGLNVTREMQRAYDRFNKPIKAAQKNVDAFAEERRIAVQARQADRAELDAARRALQLAKQKTSQLQQQLAIHGQILRLTNQQARAAAQAANSATRQQIAQANASRAAANAAAAQSRAQAAALRTQMLQQRQMQQSQQRTSPQRPQFSSPPPSFGPSLTGVAAGIIGGVSITRFLDAAEDFQRLQQRLAQVTKSGEEVKVLFDRLSSSAQNLRVPVSDLGELFVKLRQSNSQLGLTYGQTARLTEAFAAALRLSGASGQAASSSLLQFGQAMAKGRLDGDEFSTVAENASEVLRVLERQTGKTRGELLEMRKAGKLTAQMLADALLVEADALEKKIATLPPTISQAKTVFMNSIIEMIGGSKDLQQSMENLARSIITVGNFLSENGTVIIGVGRLAAELWVLYRALAAIAAIGGMRGALALVAANPILAGIGVVAGAGLIGYEMGRAEVAAAEKAFNDRIATEAAGYKKLQEQRERSEEKLQAVIRLRGKNSKEAATAAAEMIAVQDAATKRTKEIESNYFKAQMALGRAQLNLIDSRKKGYTTQAEDAKRVLGKAESDYKAAKALYDKTVLVDKVMDSGGGKKAPPLPSKDTASTPKDDTDEFIRSAEALAKRGLLLEKDFVRLQEIAKKEKEIAENVKLGAIARENARQRVDAVSAALQAFYFQNQAVNGEVEKQERLVDVLNKNYENLTRTLQNTANVLTKKEITDASEELHKAQKELAKVILGSGPEDAAMRQALLTKIAELQAKIKQLQEELAKRDGAGVGTGGKPTEGKKDKKGKTDEEVTLLERHFERLKRGLADTFLSAPGDLIDTYFTAIADSVNGGGEKVRAAMMRALGGISSKAGKQLIEMGMTKLAMVAKGAFGSLFKSFAGPTTALGGFLTKIKAALANPLIAGPALLAIGVAMAAYGAKMGAIGQNAGELGGGIGGLSIGGREAVQRFSFADRRNPLAGNRVINEETRNITFAPTIIGANDPVAQRQLGEMFNNAARRGIIRKS